MPFVVWLWHCYFDIAGLPLVPFTVLRLLFAIVFVVLLRQLVVIVFYFPLRPLFVTFFKIASIP